MANPDEEIFNFLERIEGGSNMILSNKGLSLSFASSRSASILLLVNIYDKEAATIHDANLMEEEIKAKFKELPVI